MLQGKLAASPSGKELAKSANTGKLIVKEDQEVRRAGWTRQHRVGRRAGLWKQGPPWAGRPASCAVHSAVACTPAHQQPHLTTTPSPPRPCCAQEGQVTGRVYWQYILAYGFISFLALIVLWSSEQVGPWGADQGGVGAAQVRMSLK